jgi:predicted transcriptional regulator
MIEAKGGSFETNKVYEAVAAVYSDIHRFAVSCSEREPAIKVEESIKDDYLVCLIDGEKVKMLRKYLKRKHQMDPSEYIREYKLPANYPMVAPKYSEQRRALAKRARLGHLRERRMPDAKKAKAA